MLYESSLRDYRLLFYKAQSKALMELLELGVTSPKPALRLDPTLSAWVEIVGLVEGWDWISVIKAKQLWQTDAVLMRDIGPKREMGEEGLILLPCGWLGYADKKYFVKFRNVWHELRVS